MTRAKRSVRDRAIAKFARDTDMTYSQLAQRFGVSVYTVWNALVVNGLIGRRKTHRGSLPGPNERTQQILQALEDGERPSAVARRFGVTRQAVYEACKRHGKRTTGHDANGSGRHEPT